MKWIIEMNKIKNLLENKNIIEIIQSDIDKLTEKCKKLLQIASCGKSVFEIETLSSITNWKIDEIIFYLREAIFLGIIQQNDKKQNNLTQYKFTHDKIQESFYLLIEKDEKLNLHKTIGFSQKNIQKIDNSQLFILSKHLNICKYLIDIEEDQKFYLKINKKSCIFAYSIGCYHKALDIAIESIQFLEYFYGGKKEIFHKKHSISLYFYKIICETKFLMQDFEGSEKAFEIVISNTNNLLEKIEIGKIRMSLYNIIGNYSKSLDIGIDLLNLLLENDKMKNKSKKEKIIQKGLDISIMHKKLDLLLNKIQSLGGIDYLESLPRVVHNELNIFHKIVHILSPTCFILKDFTLYGLLPIIAIKKSLKYGITDCFSPSLTHLSVTLLALNPSKLAIDFANFGWKLAMEYKNASCISNAGIGKLLLCYIDENATIENLEIVYKECIISCLQTHDINTLVYIETCKNWYQEIFGLPLPIILEDAVKAYQKTISYCKFDSLSTIQGSIESYLILNKDQPPTNKYIKLIDEISLLSPEKLSKCPESMVSSYYQQIMRSYYMIKDYKNAQINFLILQKNIPHIKACQSFFDFQFWGPLVYLTFDDVSLDDKILFLNDCLFHLKIYSDLCSKRFEHKKICIEAEILRLQDDQVYGTEILQKYEKSIELASEFKFYNVAAIVTERFMDFCRIQNLFVLESSLTKQSHTFYESYGSSVNTMNNNNNNNNRFTFTPPKKRNASISNATLNRISNLIINTTDMKDILKLVAKVC